MFLSNSYFLFYSKIRFILVLRKELKGYLYLKSLIVLLVNLSLLFFEKHKTVSCAVCSLSPPTPHTSRFISVRSLVLLTILLFTSFEGRKVLTMVAWSMPVFAASSSSFLDSKNWSEMTDWKLFCLFNNIRNCINLKELARKSVWSHL